MNQKTAIVTASSGKIGGSIASSLAKSGYDLVLQYFQNREPLDELIESGNREGVSVEAMQIDLSVEEGAKELVAETIERFGRIDVLVNTIGPCVFENILRVSPSDWRESVQLNLNSVFNVIYYARPHIIRQRGQIINFGYAGVDHLTARSESTAYCAAKAGLVILTRTLAAELGRVGVRVNAVCPGWIDDLPDGAPPGDEILDKIPLGRRGSVLEVAEVVEWLLERSPEYVTGAIIPVGGAAEY